MVIRDKDLSASGREGQRQLPGITVHYQKLLFLIIDSLALLSPYLMPEILHALLKLAEQDYHCTQLLGGHGGERLATMGDSVDEELLVHVQAADESYGVGHLC